MMRNLMMVVIVLASVSLAFGQAGQAQPPKDQPRQDQPPPPKKDLPKQEQPRPPKSDEPKASAEKQAVTFETSDGVKIAADYYSPAVEAGQKAPVAILIHMYPADRKSWEPLVPRLSEAGFAVLAYDIRGNGGSVEPAAKNLQKMYKDQDPALFKDAWKDAEAAKKWLATKPECDVNKIAMIGASIGCSISLEYGSRDEAVKAIVCLSPGTDYFGVDSIASIRKCGKRAMLMMSPKTRARSGQEACQGVERRGQGRGVSGQSRTTRDRHAAGSLWREGQKADRRVCQRGSRPEGQRERQAAMSSAGIMVAVLAGSEANAVCSRNGSVRGWVRERILAPAGIANGACRALFSRLSPCRRRTCSRPCRRA